MLFKRFWFPEEKSELLLHPAVSVLTNLTAYERAALIRSVAYITFGGDTEITPEVEINGTLLPLTPEIVHQYGLAGANIDMVVTIEDIDAALRGAEHEIPLFDPSAVDVPSILMNTPAGIHFDLDECREEYARWVEKRDENSETLSRAINSHKDVERELEAARKRLQEAKSIITTPAGNNEAIAKAKEPFEQQIMMLSGQLRIVEHRIKEYSTSDMGQLKNLVDAVRQESLLLSNSVADDLDTKMRAVADMERRMGERGIPLDATLERYNAAQEKLEFFTSKMMGPNISNEEQAQLEEIHEELVSLDSSNKKHTTRIASLQEQQDSILNKLGFPTWAAYLMAEQVAAADPLTTRELDDAREEFKEAEEHWLRVSAVVQSTDGYMEALEALDHVATFAKGLVGVPAENMVSADELSAHLRQTVLSTGQPTALSQELENRLVKMGLLVPEGHNIAAMMVASKSFFDANRAGVALQELSRERSKLVESLQRVKEQIRVIEQQSVQVAQDVLGHIAELYESVDTAEKRKKELEAEITKKQGVGSHFISGIQEAQRKINDLVLLMAEHDHLVAHGVMEEEEELSHDERLKHYIFNLFAQVRNVGQAGSVPLVFDDAFMNLPSGLLYVVLNEVARYSEVSQAVILTDDPTIANWALEVGPMQAKVISSTNDTF